MRSGVYVATGLIFDILVGCGPPHSNSDHQGYHVFSRGSL